MGGALGRTLTVFDRLRITADIYVPNHMRFYPYFLCWDIETITPNRPTPGTNEDKCKNDNQEAVGENQNIDENNFLSPSFRPRAWLEDHEIAYNIPENREDALSQFLFKEWRRYRSDRSTHARWRVRFCQPPFSQIDGNDWEGIQATQKEEKAFRRTINFCEIRKIVLRGLSIISSERRCAVKVNFWPIICARKNKTDFEYKLIKSRKAFFPSAIDLPNFQTVVEELNQGPLKEIDFETSWRSHLKENCPKNYTVIGILAFEFVFDYKRMEFLYELTPLSAVAAGNFQNFDEPKFFCLSPDEEDNEQGAKKLIGDLVDYFYQASSYAETKMRRRFRKYLKELKDKKNFFREKQLPYESACYEAEQELLLRGVKNPGSKQISQEAETILLNSTRIHFGQKKAAWNEEDIKEFKEDKRTFNNLCKLSKELDSYLRELPILG